ncbi:MAG TPA: branched-chain amino acid ABC transporter permease [Candidatus Avimonas sp.]|nr:branched-chain amino acid ABC transporter permease [Clostridiales bacterium]HPU58301.1 branched-chain amino acid ABC transporter permease [Candidatus Avimonas sp.]
MGYLKKKTGVYYLINAVLVFLLFFVLLNLINNRIINRTSTQILTLICINIILAVSLNLVTGVLGQLVLGHAGFMLVGAYTSALFTMNIGLDLKIAFPISLVLAGLMAAVFGVIIGIPALRLKGDYLAIITLGFGEIIRVIANNLKITNGAMGLSGIKSLSTTKNPSPMFIYAYALAALTVFLMFTFGRSRHGRAVIAIREDEIAAESMGINTTYYKLFTFVLAAFFAGVAGGVFAHQIGVIDPSKFDFNRSVEILIMVVLGGMGSITGSVISATVLTWLPEQLREFSKYRLLVYSIILILVMLFKPSGLLGRYEISIPKFLDKLFARITKKTAKTKTGGA